MRAQAGRGVGPMMLLEGHGGFYCPGRLVFLKIRGQPAPSLKANGAAHVILCFPITLKGVMVVSTKWFRCGFLVSRLSRRFPPWRGWYDIAPKDGDVLDMCAPSITACTIPRRDVLDANSRALLRWAGHAVSALITTTCRRQRCSGTSPTIRLGIDRA